MGHSVASTSVPKASRERPGISKSAPGRQKGRPGAPGSAPRRPKSTPSRVREQKIRVVLARFTRRPIFGRFSPDFRSIFGCSRKAFGERSRGELRSIFGSSTRSLTLTKHRPQRCFVRVGDFEASRLARVRKPRKSTKIDSKIEARNARAVSNEKPRKSTPKSTKNRRKSRLGAARATFSVDFGRSKRLGRATRSDSGRLERLGVRLGATKSIEVGQSGSVGSSRSGDPPRIHWR